MRTNPSANLSRTFTNIKIFVLLSFSVSLSVLSRLLGFTMHCLNTLTVALIWRNIMRICRSLKLRSQETSKVKLSQLLTDVTRHCLTDKLSIRTLGNMTDTGLARTQY